MEFLFSVYDVDYPLLFATRRIIWYFNNIFLKDWELFLLDWIDICVIACRIFLLLKNNFPVLILVVVGLYFQYTLSPYIL